MSDVIKEILQWRYGKGEGRRGSKRARWRTVLRANRPIFVFGLPL